MAAVLTHSQNNLENVTVPLLKSAAAWASKYLVPHQRIGRILRSKQTGRDPLRAWRYQGRRRKSAVEAIIQEREARGPFEDIFEVTKRLTNRSVNKKTFECLALSGAFDCFTGHTPPSVYLCKRWRHKPAGKGHQICAQDPAGRAELTSQPVWRRHGRGNAQTAYRIR